ncbi:hypothetical protein Pint_36628 [Pistacia integerrima]|uniref:Uncharacterized protein n=1 Tax=Pistacia integerrima TaxID=434235 RepID=A0ACC0Y3E1_9ROSI|nr:hypothetical protein Pint_36628 [Pistacia integerrima]
MPSILTLQVHVSAFSCSNIIPLVLNPFSNNFIIHLKMINLTSVSLALLVAVFSISTSTFLLHPNLTASFLKYFGTNVALHKRHKPSHHGKVVSICDDFPADFIPPDTNTTSYFGVDRNGCCNFTTVQSAVDAVANFSLKRNIIFINSGIYYEKVIVPRTKPNITFQGQGYTSTAIVWNDTAKSANGTFYSGSVQVFANNFIAKNISFMNVAPIPNPGDVGAQAVAIRVSGDEAAFWGCGFFGAQDTLHDDRGRHYFKDCYIQGSIDFIFGNGRSLYETKGKNPTGNPEALDSKNCALISIASPVAPGSKLINGAVTAHGRTSKDENTGFAFVNCSVGGTGRIWLGRAWRPFSRVVFALSSMTDIIAPGGLE